MTQLVDALHALGLEGELSLADRWAKLQGQHCWVYVAEAPWGNGYYTWCDDPQSRAVEFYRDATEAIQAGLRRAAKPELDKSPTETSDD
jgi:hypothetical protein